MRHPFVYLFVIAGLLIFGGSLAAQHLSVLPGVPHTAAQKVHADLAMRQGLLIIDVREAREFAVGHVPGAINIPLEDLQQTMSSMKVPKDRSIVTVCDKGGRSSHAVAVLEKMGYHASSYCTLDSWKRAGYQTEAGASSAKPERTPKTSK